MLGDSSPRGGREGPTGRMLGPGDRAPGRLWSSVSALSFYRTFGSASSAELLSCRRGGLVPRAPGGGEGMSLGAPAGPVLEQRPEHSREGIRRPGALLPEGGRHPIYSCASQARSRHAQRSVEALGAETRPSEDRRVLGPQLASHPVPSDRRTDSASSGGDGARGLGTAGGDWRPEICPLSLPRGFSFPHCRSRHVDLGSRLPPSSQVAKKDRGSQGRRLSHHE